MNEYYMWITPAFFCCTSKYITFRVCQYPFFFLHFASLRREKHLGQQLNDSTNTLVFGLHFPAFSVTEAGFSKQALLPPWNCNFRDAVIEFYEHSQQVSSTSGKGKLAVYVTCGMCVGVWMLQLFSGVCLLRKLQGASCILGCCYMAFVD